MILYLLSATHPSTPGVSQSIHLQENHAFTAACDLLDVIAKDIEATIPAPADPAQWQDYLRSIQRHRIKEESGETADTFNDDELFELTGFEITNSPREAPTPRVIVSLDGGLVEGICSDIELDAHIVDYDTDGGDMSEIIDIPQDESTNAEAFVRGENVKIDSQWIDNVLAAYEAHDPDARDEDEEED